MKAVHTREYWASRWDEMIRKVPDHQYMNLEAELARKMECIDEGLKAAEASITAEQYEAIKRIQAQPIIEKATARCREQMAMIKRIDRGESSLGGGNEAQRIRIEADARARFEFNCYQLAVFREKYSAQ